MTRRQTIEHYLRRDHPIAWVANTLGVTESYVRRIKRELEAGIEPRPVGRPRVRVSEAEACARYLEQYKNAGLEGLVAGIRAGRWREFL